MPAGQGKANRKLGHTVDPAPQQRIEEDLHETLMNELFLILSKEFLKPSGVSTGKGNI